MHQFRSGNKPTAAKLDKMLTEARANMAWLREGSSVTQQQTIRNYALSLNHSFKVSGRGRPRVKRRKTDTLTSLNYTMRGFSIREGRLRLPGRVSVPVVWSRELPSVPSSVRVYEDAAGWWWASFVVEVPDHAAVNDFPEYSIGIDWGIKTTATATDDNYDLPYKNTIDKHARAVAKHQRRMALHKQQRDEEEKRAYRRAKKRAARAQRTARWQRREHARQWAQDVAHDHGSIAVEDFRPKFLAKSRMARKMHDAAIGQLRQELVLAAEKFGSELIVVPAAYTTMTCSKCGARAKSRLELNERVFVCSQCGHTQDRDKNAAFVILSQAGLNLALDDGHKSELASANSAS